MLVDAASEYTWAPRKELERIGVGTEKKDLSFVMANGQHITRNVGFAIVRVGERFTVDEVVFAEEGDLLLLGARALVGLNLAVDSEPFPAAQASDLVRPFRAPEIGAALPRPSLSAYASLRQTRCCLGYV